MMPPATNGFAGAQRWIDEYEKHEAAKQQIMIEAAAKCAPINEMMKEVKAAAKNAGIPVKVFSAALLERKHLRNAAKVRDKLDDDLQDELDQLRSALDQVADLPIFGAAIEAAERAAGRRSERAQNLSDGIDDLTDGDDGDVRPRFLRDGEGGDDVGVDAPAKRSGRPRKADAEPAATPDVEAENVTRLHAGIRSLN